MIKNKSTLFLIILGSVLFCLTVKCAYSTEGQPDKTISKSKADQSKSDDSVPIIRSQLNINFLRHPPIKNKINEPSDLANLIPIIRDINRLIPRRFSLADHQVTLNAHEMVIKHQFMDSKKKDAIKNSVITLGYDDVGGRNVDTYLEVPLFYSSASGPSLSDWYRYPLGNYTMRITRSSTFSPEERLYIRAITRF